MLIWISFALLAAAVTTLLLRQTTASTDREQNPDLAVYRDQIAEIESDAERGVIDRDQARAARAEVARRLLKEADPPPSVKAPPPPVASDRVLLIGASAIPLLSLGLYLWVGSPSLPGRPLKDRLAEAPDKAAPDDMIAKVEARLREKPDDGLGWSVIAPVYLGQGRALEAIDAYANAIRLVGETPERLSGLGKAHVLVGNGIVNEAARKAYTRLLELEPARAEARYWLAVWEEQNGRPQVAADTYQMMLANAPPDAPWKASVEERLKAVTQVKSGPPQVDPARPPAPPAVGQSAMPGPLRSGENGPSPTEFVAAAQKLAPEMREAMIGGKMIPKARDAVKANPKDVAAWSRIVTGLMALGKSAEARASLQEARAAVTGDAAALAELDQLAKAFGLAS